MNLPINQCDHVRSFYTLAFGLAFLDMAIDFIAFALQLRMGAFASGPGTEWPGLRVMKSVGTAAAVRAELCVANLNIGILLCYLQRFFFF